MAESLKTTAEFAFFLCPITHQLFKDPVLAEDGHTYEREAIVKWIQEHGTSPITRQLLNIDQLRPNCTIKNILNELQSKNFYFKLDVHVKKKSRRALFQAHGKTVWEADWIGTDGPPICLMKINGVKALKEASFYEKMTRHPYIVKTYGIVDEPSDVTSNSIMLLQEYASEGNLFEVLQEQPSVPNQNILWEMFFQISDAMTFLAHNQIVHGDLACLNVLVFRFDANESKNNLVKLTDFGLSRGSSMYAPVSAASRTALTIVPIRYAAPEVLSNSNDRNSYTEKSDVFSMGVLMWEAYSKGEMPWSNIENDNEVSRKVINGERLKQPSKCNDTVWAIILKCMSQQANDRPVFEELKRHLLGFMLGSINISEPKIICMKVAHTEDDDIVEIALEEGHYISLSALNLQFPGIAGLKYRSQPTNTWQTLAVLETRLQRPQNESPDTIYIAQYPEGFKDEEIDDYVHQFFNQVAHNSHLEERCQKAEAELKFLKSHPKIWDTAHVPVNLGLICNLWNSEHSLQANQTTMTQLYTNIIEYLLRRYLENQMIDTNYMNKNEIYDYCQEELKILRIIAFEAMKSNSLVIKKHIVENTLKNIEYDPSKRATIATKLLKIGIFKRLSQSECSKRNETERGYYFIHLSFQEYFAAQYLTNNLTDSNSEMLQFIQTQKYNKRFLSLFTFASGLISETTSSSCTQLFWNVLLRQPLDLIGLRHLELIICCLDEAGHRNTIPNIALLLNKIQCCLKINLTKRSTVNHKLIHILKCNSFLQRQPTMNNIIHQIIANKSPTTIWIVASLPETPVEPELIKVLVEALNNQNFDIRLVARSSLHQLLKKQPTPELITTLLQAGKYQNGRMKTDVAFLLEVLVEHKYTPAIINVLVHALKDPDHCVREQAASTLGSLGDKAATLEVINGLLLALKDPDHDVREHAASALGNLGDKAATHEVASGLLLAMNDQDWHVRCSAISAISKLSTNTLTTRVINELLLALKDQNHSVIDNAASALEQLANKGGTTEVVTGLQIALKDQDHYVRKLAASTLGRLGDKAATVEVTNTLLLLLKDQDGDVRWAVAHSLVELVTTSSILNVFNTLLKMLEHQEDCAFYALKVFVEEKSTPETISRLLETLKDNSNNIGSRAAMLLGQLNDKIVTPDVINGLLLALKDKNKNVRCHAASSLAILVTVNSSPEVVNTLLSAIKDQDHNVRANAISALGQISDNRVTHTMITELLLIIKDPNVDVKCAVLSALGNLASTTLKVEVITELLLAMKHQDPKVRDIAVRAVGNLASKTSTPELITGLLQTLTDPDRRVRLNTIWALRKLDNREVTTEMINALLLALKDQDKEIRFWAVSSIEKLGEKAAIPKVINDLIQVQKDQDDNVIWRAAYALKILVQKKPVPEIINVLIQTLSDEDHHVKYAVIGALATLFKKKPAPEIINVLIQTESDEDYNVKCAVIGALDTFYEKEAPTEVMKWLLHALEDSHDGIQRQAASILSRFPLCSAVLSQLGTDVLSRFATYDNVFYNTPIYELFNTYLKTHNDTWLSIIYNCAIIKKFGVALVNENIMIFQDEEQPCEIKIPIQKVCTVSNTLIQSFGNEADKYGLRWN